MNECIRQFSDNKSIQEIATNGFLKKDSRIIVPTRRGPAWGNFSRKY